MNDDMTPPEEEIDHAAIQADIDLYAEMMIQEERGKVSDIKKPQGKELGYTDDGLIPLEQSDIVYERMIFDAEQSLRDSADQKWLIDGIIPSDGFGILY